jgi:VWFA-related protein
MGFRLGVLFRTMLVTAVCVQGQQFRSTITLVPIEVRVTDKNGDPIRGLVAADFTVKEAGVLQQVAHFQTIASDAEAASIAGRTFMIVLGRGRLNEPTKAVQALIDFVRVRLDAGDQVGAIAYHRVIPVTTDHNHVAAFLERYRDGHAAAETLLARDNRSRIVPRVTAEDTRAAMDAAFHQESSLRDLAGGAGNAASFYNDFRYLKVALEYLRTVDGDKHVVMVTEEPFAVGRTSDDLLESFWFLQATSARTALHFVHAGGLNAKSNRGLTSRGISPAYSNAMFGRNAQELVAQQTGGTSTFFQNAANALAMLDRSTRVRYLLGYYPTRDLSPEQYRQIEVSVSKPGARLSYRQGYQARPAIDKTEDYREAQVAARLEYGAWRLLNPSAFGNVPASDRGMNWDMRLVATMSTVPERQSLQVAVAFDPRLTMFTKKGDRYIAELDLTLLADDEQRRVIGQTRRHLRLELSAEEFARTKRQWPTVDVTVDVTGRAAYVRGVLYQFDTDRIAMSQVRVRRTQAPRTLPFVARPPIHKPTLTIDR